MMRVRILGREPASFRVTLDSGNFPSPESAPLVGAEFVIASYFTFRKRLQHVVALSYGCYHI